MLCIWRVCRPRAVGRHGRWTAEAGAGAAAEDGRPLAGGRAGPAAGARRPAAAGSRTPGFEHLPETTSRGCTHMTRHEDPIYRITTYVHVCAVWRVYSGAQAGAARAAAAASGPRWAKLGARGATYRAVCGAICRAARRAAEGALSGRTRRVAGRADAVSLSRAHSASSSRTLSFCRCRAAGGRAPGCRRARRSGRSALPLTAGAGGCSCSLSHHPRMSPHAMAATRRGVSGRPRGRRQGRGATAGSAAG